jgi:hypothetical protein
MLYYDTNLKLHVEETEFFLRRLVLESFWSILPMKKWKSLMTSISRIKVKCEYDMTSPTKKGIYVPWHSAADFLSQSPMLKAFLNDDQMQDSAPLLPCTTLPLPSLTAGNNLFAIVGGGMGRGSKSTDECSRNFSLGVIKN